MPGAQDPQYDALAERFAGLSMEEAQALYATLSLEEQAAMDKRGIQTLWRSIRARNARAAKVRLGMEKAMQEAHARAEAKRNRPPPGT